MQIKHTLMAFMLMFAVAGRAHAQSIVMCESYDEKGAPSGIYTSWDIQADGGFVYILYSQPATFNTSSLWYLYIDYDWYNNGNLSAYETISLTPERGKNWIVYDYKFKDVGKYRAYVMKDGVEQASVNFTINWAEGVTPPAGTTTGATTGTTTSGVDTYYYEDSFIQFCSSVNTDGTCNNPATSYVIPTGSSSVESTVLLDNNLKDFKTKTIWVDIYKDGAEDPFDSFSVAVEETWNFCWFKVSFSAPGTYYIDTYTADDIFINTASVVVSR